MRQLHLCPQCEINQASGPADHICGVCRYRNRVKFMLGLDPEDQDWEFAHCEECGSSLNDRGECPNTSCGNSPYVGEDWY